MPSNVEGGANWKGPDEANEVGPDADPPTEVPSCPEGIVVCEVRLHLVLSLDNEDVDLGLEALLVDVEPYHEVVVGHTLEVLVRSGLDEGARGLNHELRYHETWQRYV